MLSKDALRVFGVAYEYDDPEKPLTLEMAYSRAGILDDELAENVREELVLNGWIVRSRRVLVPTLAGQVTYRMITNQSEEERRERRL